MVRGGVSWGHLIRYLNVEKAGVTVSDLQEGKTGQCRGVPRKGRWEEKAPTGGIKKEEH